MNSNLETREENEYEIDLDKIGSGGRFKTFFEDEKKALKSYPYIMKIRRVIDCFPNAEIVVDSFINTDFIFFSPETIMEIELKNTEDKSVFGQILKDIDLGPVNDVTDTKDYTNHSMALKSFEKHGKLQSASTS